MSTSIAVTLLVDLSLLIRYPLTLTAIFRWPPNNKLNYDGQKYDCFATSLPYLAGNELIRSRFITGFVAMFNYLNVASREGGYALANKGMDTRRLSAPPRSCQYCEYRSIFGY